MATNSRGYHEMRKLITLAAAGSLLLGILAPAQAGKPATLWEDPAGDADNGQGAGGSIPGGFDLVSGTIAKKKKNLEFTVTHADMPPSGSMPEGFRFMWAFGVGDEMHRITVKSADIGKPDILAGQTSDRIGRVDLEGHFRLEGNCGAGEAIGVLQPINCEVIEYVDGSFDPASMSFTAIVPMKLIKAKVGSLITPGGGDAATICQVCWITHTAERSLETTFIDTASMTGSYKIPKK